MKKSFLLRETCFTIKKIFYSTYSVLYFFDLSNPSSQCRKSNGNLNNKSAFTESIFGDKILLLLMNAEENGEHKNILGSN